MMTSQDDEDEILSSQSIRGIVHEEIAKVSQRNPTYLFRRAKSLIRSSACSAVNELSMHITTQLAHF